MLKHKNQFTGPGNVTSSGDLLDDAETAALLGITSRTLRLWRHRRGLPHIRITNREIRYRRADLDEWLGRMRTVIS